MKRKGKGAAMAVTSASKHVELEDIRAANRERWATHRTAEVHAEVTATDVSGDKDKTVEVRAFGGFAYINSHGEAKLDQTALIQLQRELSAAFQAVS